MSSSTVSFIYQWQTLIGSALGPFLAIILSAFGFWVKSKYTASKDKKDNINTVEVAITRTINDMYFTKLKLENFIVRTRKLSRDAKAVTDDHTYFLEVTNFPAMRDIFFDTDLPNLKFGSPYLHNQLMFSDAGIKETNSWLKELKENFSSLIHKNEFVTMVVPKAQPKDQRDGYAENLKIFADAVEGFLVYINTGIRMAIQIKVYNLKLMKDRKATINKYERLKFKFFKSKEEVEKYENWQNMLDRIDAAIKDEVDKLLAKTEEDYEKRKKASNA